MEPTVATVASVACLTLGSIVDAQCDPQQVQKLVAQDGAAGDFFGHAVAISGDWAIIGSPGDDPDSAYLFRDTGGGTWQEVGKITPRESADSFGAAVDISADHVVVGAQFDDENGERSGSAYIFRNDGTGNWVEIGELVPDDGAPGDEFGNAVGIFGDTVVVGAYLEEDPGRRDTGAAYISVTMAAATGDRCRN